METVVQKDNKSLSKKTPTIDNCTKENDTKENGTIYMSQIKKFAPPTPQAAFVQKWKELYKAKTNYEYKADRQDYILIARLLNKYTEAVILDKAKILFTCCEKGGVWFAQSMGDFTIGKLSKHWNHLLPNIGKSKNECAMETWLNKMKNEELNKNEHH